MKTKKAAVLPAAREINQRVTAYYIPTDKSIEKLKESVGILLLRLSAGQEGKDCWQVFESSLRQYLDLKLREVRI